MSVGKHIIGYTQLLPDVIVFGNILRPLEHSDFVALVLGKLHIALVTLLYAARGWDWYSGIILVSFGESGMKLDDIGSRPSLSTINSMAKSLPLLRIFTWLSMQSKR